MAVRSFVVSLAALVLLFAAPAASAAPIAVSVTAPPLGELDVGESGTVQFTVSVSSDDNIVCPQGASITVGLEAQRADPSLGLSAAVAPTSMSFTIDAGAYTTATSAWSPDDQTGDFTVTLDGALLPAGHAAHTFVVVATYAGGTGPGTCQTSASTWGESSAQAEISVTPVFPDEPAVPGGPTGPTGGNETPTGGGGGDSEDSPAPAFVYIVLAILVVAFARRRA